MAHADKCAAFCAERGERHEAETSFISASNCSMAPDISALVKTWPCDAALKADEGELAPAPSQAAPRGEASRAHSEAHWLGPSSQQNRYPILQNIRLSTAADAAATAGLLAFPILHSTFWPRQPISSSIDLSRSVDIDVKAILLVQIL